MKAFNRLTSISRFVDVLEELLRITYLTRDVRDFLVDRYSERKEFQLTVDLKKM